MFAIIGTIPDQDFPLTYGPVAKVGGHLQVRELSMDIQRGTPALLAAAVTVAEELALAMPTAFLVGDIGTGVGSRQLYRFLVEQLPHHDFSVLTFHYLMPDVDWHNRVLFAIEDMKKRPLLIADAGFMYAAKMSGEAGRYDLFTPDAGELAFLADEEAPHPFYTRGFILHEDNKVPDLITRAYQHGNASKYLLVKGATDYLAGPKGIISRIDQPANEAMEAIGGTGDTLTGIVSGLLSADYALTQAVRAGCLINRLAGCLADPSPATSISEIIARIPEAIRQVKAPPQPTFTTYGQRGT